MSVVLEALDKRFGDTRVIAGLDVTFEQGRISVMLGASGCGKTTTLRCIAGLEHPDGGRISIGGRAVLDRTLGLDVPPERRNVAMVFQSYAIWPHMSVAENVRLPLRARGVGAAEAAAKVERALDTVGLAGFGGRNATQLSGGQQQRVALARCIASESPVILLDEPLSNLDARLRVTMRQELRDLQHRLGTTMIFVTHDQEEAMVLADRVVLFNAGRIEQSGPPEEIYRQPRTRYAAEFFGKVNFVPVAIGPPGPDARVLLAAPDIQLLAPPDVPLPNATQAKGTHPGATQPNAICAIRPEAWRLAPASPGAIAGRVVDVTPLGDRAELRVDTALGRQTVVLLGRSPVAIGDSVHLDPRPAFVHLIAPEPR